MQAPNLTTIPKYDGVIEHLLISCGCVELSEVTPTHLDRFLARQSPTPLQRSRLYSLWNGASHPSSELVALLEAICSKK
jgi:hypothetical protein